MNMKKCGSILASLALGLALASGPAVAGVTFFSPQTGFEGDDIDFHIDDDGDGIVEATDGNGLIDVGERLVAAFEYTATFGIFGGGPAGFGGDELTGIADITVLTKVAGSGAGLFDFTFGPSTGGFVDGLAAGGMYAIFLDPNPNLDLVGTPCTSLADCTAKASDGSLFLVLGFAGDTDEIWEVLDALDSTAAAKLVGPTTTIGEFDYATSVLTNGTGMTLEPIACTLGECSGVGDGFIGAIGSGDLNGGLGLTNGAVARSDSQFRVGVAVPEPASLALLGAGLMGIGASFRRRRK